MNPFNQHYETAYNLQQPDLETTVETYFNDNNISVHDIEDSSIDDLLQIFQEKCPYTTSTLDILNTKEYQHLSEQIEDTEQLLHLSPKSIKLYYEDFVGCLQPVVSCISLFEAIEADVHQAETLYLSITDHQASPITILLSRDAFNIFFPSKSEIKPITKLEGSGFNANLPSSIQKEQLKMKKREKQLRKKRELRKLQKKQKSTHNLQPDITSPTQQYIDPKETNLSDQDYEFDDEEFDDDYYAYDSHDTDQDDDDDDDDSGTDDQTDNHAKSTKQAKKKKSLHIPTNTNDEDVDNDNIESETEEPDRQLDNTSTFEQANYTKKCTKKPSNPPIKKAIRDVKKAVNEVSYFLGLKQPATMTVVERKQLQETDFNLQNPHITSEDIFILASQDTTEVHEPTLDETVSLRERFFAIASLAQSVVFARAEPAMKKRIVSSINQMFPKTISLAIGDGANDTEMISVAHIGVGLAGVEGSAAANAADYALCGFRMLHTLLLVHGTRSYARLSKLISFVFYKAVLVAFINYLYGFYSAFSGQQLFNDFYFQFYNILYTALPILIIGILDAPLPASVLENTPVLYRDQKGKLFNGRIFSAWVLRGIIHSIIVFYITMGPLLWDYNDILGGPTQEWRGKTYSHWYFSTMQLVINAVLPNLVVILFMESITLIHILVLILSNAFIFIALLILSASTTFNSEFYYHGILIIGNGQTWMTMILACTIVLLSEFFIQFILNHVFAPSLNVIMKERFYLAKKRLQLMISSMPSLKYKMTKAYHTAQQTRELIHEQQTQSQNPISSPSYIHPSQVNNPQDKESKSMMNTGSTSEDIISEPLPIIPTNSIASKPHDTSSVDKHDPLSQKSFITSISHDPTKHAQGGDHLKITTKSMNGISDTYSNHTSTTNPHSSYVAPTLAPYSTHDENGASRDRDHGLHVTTTVNDDQENHSPTSPLFTSVPSDSTLHDHQLGLDDESAVITTTYPTSHSHSKPSKSNLSLMSSNSSNFTNGSMPGPSLQHASTTNSGTHHHQNASLRKPALHNSKSSTSYDALFSGIAKKDPLTPQSLSLDISTTQNLNKNRHQSDIRHLETIESVTSSPVPTPPISTSPGTSNLLETLKNQSTTSEYVTMDVIDPIANEPVGITDPIDSTSPKSNRKEYEKVLRENEKAALVMSALETPLLPDDTDPFPLFDAHGELLIRATSQLEQWVANKSDDRQNILRILAEAKLKQLRKDRLPFPKDSGKLAKLPEDHPLQLLHQKRREKWERLSVVLGIKCLLSLYDSENTAEYHSTSDQRHIQRGKYRQTKKPHLNTSMARK